MKFIVRFLVLVLLFCVVGKTAYGQNDKDKVLQLIEKAVKLEDQGKFDEALKILDEALKLDPSNLEIQYEMAYSYNGLKQYDKVKSIMEELVKGETVYDLFFEMLGNAYDMLGYADKAIEIYKIGLNKFPNSGRLYLELCVTENNRKNYNEALEYCEKGINVDPEFPSNYYWAARFYCNSNEKIWGLIYGEIFMNLERSGVRTEEISALLYDTYKSGITFESDTIIAVRFSKKSNELTIGNDNKPKIPFEMDYELATSVSVDKEKTIDINSLDRIRTRFLGMYFKMGHDKKYPNILFNYQKKVQNSGNLEGYNHWILMQGDLKNFDTWYNNSKDKWDKFMEWFPKNQLKVNKNKKFHREQF